MRIRMLSNGGNGLKQHRSSQNKKPRLSALPIYNLGLQLAILEVMKSTTMPPRVKALREAPLDSWVVLSQDESRVVAVGQDFERVAQQAQATGISEPVLIRTPKDWTVRVL